MYYLYFSRWTNAGISTLQGVQDLRIPKSATLIWLFKHYEYVFFVSLLLRMVYQYDN